MTLLQIIAGLFVLCVLGAALGYSYARGKRTRYRLVPFVARVAGFTIIGGLAAFIVPSVPAVLMGDAQAPLLGLFLVPLGLVGGAGFGYWWCLKAKDVA